MKTLFIHLSDLHLRGNAPDVSNIVSAINISGEINGCFLVFSGDFSQSGDCVQIDSFKKMFNDLIQKLNKKLMSNVYAIIVPGNHDIFIPKDYLAPDKLIDSANDEGILEEYKKCILNETNAINLCKEYDIDFEYKSVVHKYFELNNLGVHFVLINSAPFSVLGSNDKDKRLHYILPDDRQLAGFPKSNINNLEIIVSHHRPDWFEYFSQTALSSFEENIASICFYGHEHQDKNISETINNDSFIISKGGELEIINNNVGGSFATYLIDSENKQCVITNYIFDRKRFKFIKNIENMCYPIKFNNKKQLDDSFVNEIVNPLIEDNLKEQDMFIMPYLHSMGSQKDIILFDELINQISANKILTIYGDAGSGKSILLHRLFCSSVPNYETLFIDCNRINVNNIEASLESLFEDEYKTGKIVFSEFKNSALSKRIVFVDNFDTIDKDYKRIDVLNCLEKNFGHIVIATKLFNKTRRELAENRLSDETSFNMLGFTIKQRNQFILMYLNKRNITSDEEINLVYSAIEGAVSTCSILDISDPNYLLPLLKGIIDNKMYLERNAVDAFSIIFEHSIRDAILKSSCTDMMDELILVINLLAYNVAVVNKNIYFNIDDVSFAVRERKKLFNHITVSPIDVLNVLLDSGLVKQEQDKYRFERNSFLAYFAAQEIVRLHQAQNPAPFKDIVDNITFGINSDIFIFVVYTLKCVNVFYDLHDNLDKLLKNLEELNFENKNNPILKKNKKLVPESKQQSENKEQFFNRINNEERKRISIAKKREPEIYEEYSRFDDEMKAYIKCLKLIEISCKAIAGFQNEITTSDREILLECTLSSVFKIFNMMFQFKDEKEIETVETEFEKYKQDTLSKMRENGEKEEVVKRVEELDIVHAFYDYLTTYILNIETNMARIMVSKASMPVIKKLPDDVFLKFLFKTIAFQVSGNTEGFINSLKFVYSNKDFKEQQLIVSRVLRMFIIKNEVSPLIIKKISIATGFPEIRLLQFKGTIK